MLATAHNLRNNSGSFAMFTAIRWASSLVRRLRGDPDHPRNRCKPIFARRCRSRRSTSPILRQTTAAEENHARSPFFSSRAMVLGESPFWGTSARCHPISTRPRSIYGRVQLRGVPHVVGAPWRAQRRHSSAMRRYPLGVSEHGCAPFAVQAGALSVSQPPVPEGLLSCSLPVMLNSTLNHDG
jgi:hypothetical protein